MKPIPTSRLPKKAASESNRISSTRAAVACWPTTTFVCKKDEDEYITFVFQESERNGELQELYSSATQVLESFSKDDSWDKRHDLLVDFILHVAQTPLALVGSGAQVSMLHAKFFPYLNMINRQLPTLRNASSGNMQLVRAAREEFYISGTRFEDLFVVGEIAFDCY